MALLAFGLFLLTNLRADTAFPVLWLWMIIVGLGIGPSFAVFTVLVQNTVAPRMVGVATASLTFFQQIGGTIGLTIAGTALADTLTRELPGRLVANGIPTTDGRSVRGKWAERQRAQSHRDRRSRSADPRGRP